MNYEVSLYIYTFTIFLFLFIATTKNLQKFHILQIKNKNRKKT